MEPLWTCLSFGSPSVVTMSAAKAAVMRAMGSTRAEGQTGIGDPGWRAWMRSLLEEVRNLVSAYRFKSQEATYPIPPIRTPNEVTPRA